MECGMAVEVEDEVVAVVMEIEVEVVLEGEVALVELAVDTTDRGWRMKWILIFINYHCSHQI